MISNKNEDDDDINDDNDDDNDHYSCNSLTRSHKAHLFIPFSKGYFR